MFGAYALWNRSHVLTIATAEHGMRDERNVCWRPIGDKTGRVTYAFVWHMICLEAHEEIFRTSKEFFVDDHIYLIQVIKVIKLSLKVGNIFLPEGTQTCSIHDIIQWNNMSDNVSCRFTFGLFIHHAYGSVFTDQFSCDIGRLFVL